MKKNVSSFTLSILICYSSYAQCDCAETLQSISDRGNITNKILYITGEQLGNAPTAGRAINFRQFYSGAGAIDCYDHSNKVGVDLSINNSGGRVGIGTTSPAYKLDVNGTGNFQQTVIFRGGANGSKWIDFNDASGNSLGSFKRTDNGLELNTWPGGTSHLMLNPTGNVGIGTTSPVYKLDVNGSSRFSSGGVAALLASNSSPLSPNSYDRGNFEAVVSFDEFSSGARPGYGFHAAGRHGIYLYSEGLMDLRLKGESGQDATLWTSFNFSPANYLPLTGGGISGDLSIGANNMQKQLLVNGNIKTRKIKVTQTDWADYVFDSSYQLPALTHVETFIKENKHLPEVPSAAEVKKEGVDLGDNQVVLLKKIEELTLYIIQQNKEMMQQNKEVEKLKKRVADLEAK